MGCWGWERVRFARKCRHRCQGEHDTNCFTPADPLAQRQDCNRNAHERVKAGERSDDGCLSIASKGGEDSQVAQPKSKTQSCYQ